MFLKCAVKLYICHCITDDLTDDRDIQRQCRKLYAQANMLIRKFHMCSTDVKASLFRTYCTPLYTAHLWCSYRKASIQRLKVAYNDALRLFLHVPRHHSASTLFVSMDIPTCHALLRNLMYKFICRLEASKNSIIVAIVDPTKSSTKYFSSLWRHWRKSLYANLNIT